MSAAFSSALYFGRVIHKRLRPFRHRLDYRVFSVFLDLDEVPALASKTRLFSHNRWNVFSFYDRDHGPRDGSSLRRWLAPKLREAGIDLEGGRVRMLCFPRVLGYVFNPLSVWYCYDRNDRLVALLHEVRNTFGESHSYLLPVDGGSGDEVIQQSCAKRFYVSPFIEMGATYGFTLRPPDERLSFAIKEDVASGPLLIATHTGERRSFDDRTLLRAAVSYPLMTLKVMAAIHWEALKIVRKGGTFFRRPAPPPQPVTIPAADNDPLRLAAE